MSKLPLWKVLAVKIYCGFKGCTLSEYPDDEKCDGVCYAKVNKVTTKLISWFQRKIHKKSSEDCVAEVVRVK